MLRFIIHFPLPSASHRRNEQEKRRQYDSRIRTVEHGTFTPLIFTTAGGMGPAATTFYKRLASNLSDYHKKPYLLILNWIRCRLSFSLLRSAILCLRGARSSYHRPIFSNINLLDRPSLKEEWLIDMFFFYFPLFCFWCIIKVSVLCTLSHYCINITVFYLNYLSLLTIL